MRLILALALLLAPALRAVEPFFAPAQQSGSITLRLHPVEGLAPGTPRLVTFGMPFLRGSVTQAQLAQVRVLSGSTEIAAYVEQLTPWRHVTNTSLDGASVRVARIQFNYTFSVSYPNAEDVTLEWGQNNRTSSLPSLTNPRSGWQQVTTAPWVAADNVWEPQVYVLLPKAWTANGALSARRMDPLDNGVALVRENPATNDAIATWPGYTERDHAQHNNFFSLINEDDAAVTAPNQCPFKTDFEPWLYDRASAMFALYLRSGNFKHLREAVRNCTFYKGKLYSNTTTPASAIGGFSLKDPNPAAGVDSKYSYNECLAYHYWLTGDNDVYNAMDWVVQCQETNAPNSQWSPALGFWTERSVAFKLLANVILFEVKGDSAARTRITTQTGHLIWHQNGAAGTSPAIPSAGRVDGGLYHYGSQHGDGTASAFLASSWMSVLLQDAMIRAYAFTEDTNIAAFIRRMGNFLRVASKSDTAHQYGGGALYYVDYMMRYDGVSDVRSTGEEEHSLEVAAALAWSWYFSELTGAPDPAMKTMADHCYDAYDIGVNYWIRPTGPASGLTAYRVTPWRKYGWEHRPSGSLSWLMNQSGGAANTAPTITPIANQSVAVNTNTGALAFSVGDAQDAPGTLTVSAASSNATLVPNNPANLALGGSGAGRTLTVTPAAGQTGSATITLTVLDSGSLSAVTQFTLTVTSGTSAPAFGSTPPTSATAGSLYSYAISVSGTPTPTLSAAGLPSWLTLSGSTLSGAPGAGDVGVAGPITLTASNGVGTPAQQVFSITVSAAAPGESGGGGGCTTSESVRAIGAAWALALLALSRLALRPWRRQKAR